MDAPGQIGPTPYRFAHTHLGGQYGFESWLPELPSKHMLNAAAAFWGIWQPAYIVGSME